MLRTLTICGLMLCVAAVGTVRANDIVGDYLETRTCDIYTGPCFANAEVGLTGQDAIMAWSIEAGEHNDVDLAGLKVVAVVRASDTLGFGGGLVVNPDPIKSVVLVDEKADARQQAALVDFVKQHAGRVLGEVVRVEAQPIDMQLDHLETVGLLKAGKVVELTTRKMTDGDCVCTNEVVFYPPLTDVDNYEPAYTVNGRFAGRGLGNNWANPLTRSSFLATFAY